MLAKTNLMYVAALVFAMGWIPKAHAGCLCQLPNQGLNGASGDTVSAPSETGGVGAFHAEQVSVPAELSVVRVRWWGHYFNSVCICDCGATPVGVGFDIRIYEDDGAGLPGTLIHFTPGSVASRQETGLIINDGLAGNFLEYQYEADLDATVVLSPGTSYWISIAAINDFADNLCHWAWETSPKENQAARWSPSSGAWEASNFDLAYCLIDVSATPCLSNSNAIPALSTWGVLAMMLLMMVAGTVVLQRKAVA